MVDDLLYRGQCHVLQRWNPCSQGRQERCQGDRLQASGQVLDHENRPSGGACQASQGAQVRLRVFHGAGGFRHQKLGQRVGHKDQADMEEHLGHHPGLTGAQAKRLFARPKKTFNLPLVKHL